MIDNNSMPIAPYIMGSDECDSISTLFVTARRTFGSTDVRLVDANGNTFSKVTYRVLTLTDGSEVFEAVLS
jgi:hypothetical protein